MLKRKNELFSDETIITKRIKPGVILIEFSNYHPYNPFSILRMQELITILEEIKEDRQIKAIIFYGGKGRSFSAGGDFNETSKFKGTDEVSKWIDTVNDLYIKTLQMPQITIAALDGYAIGLGLQLALLCDYRYGAIEAKFSMPELKMGISCNYGSYILEKMLGRSKMLEMVFSCNTYTGQEAKELGLIQKLSTSAELMKEVEIFAEKVANYGVTSVIGTKRTFNKSFVDGLNELCEYAKESHRRSFAAGVAQSNMKKIIKKEE